ncbi:hypothetical protein C9F11_04775 [Streptomyces sp. YIM 121038]|nr:hypothetical protein C9F11_04775 [Streptomyces sp. YIM 121038]
MSGKEVSGVDPPGSGSGPRGRPPSSAGRARPAPRGAARARNARRDSQEASGFAAMLQGLMAERTWDLPAVGGSVLEHWPDISAALTPHCVPSELVLDIG